MKKYGYILVTVCCFVVPLLLLTFKVTLLGYSFNNILPESAYQVRLAMRCDGFGDKTSIRVFLPQELDQQQSVTHTRETSSGFAFNTKHQEGNQLGHWEAHGEQHGTDVQYDFTVRTKAIQYELDSSLTLPDELPFGFDKYLMATENIQANHPEIYGLADSIIPKNTGISIQLEAIYTYVNGLKKKAFKGVTSALTTLRLQEASCNGKSRLMVALCRNIGLPSRLVGGLILTVGTKKTSHQWVEVYINGHWVTFDALNGHFAFRPANYLTLYTGDHFLFAHTPNINFDYAFTVKKTQVTNTYFKEELQGSFGNSYDVWQSFENAGIPLDLLKIILLLPLGALVVALCRNVIGLKTFGIFLPTLIAIAVMSTGFWWGVMSFVGVVVLVSLLHFPLERWGILYTPKLVIMLVFVVIQFILFSTLGFKFSNADLAHVTLFPVVVLTLTAERFARSITEEGLLKTISIMVQTLLVMALAHYFISSVTMEYLFLAFPELFLVIIGLALLLGKWVGLRLVEWYRFRNLIKSDAL